MQILAALLHKHIKGIKPEEKIKEENLINSVLEKKKIKKQTNYPSNKFLHDKSLQSCGSKLHS